MKSSSISRSKRYDGGVMTKSLPSRRDARPRRPKISASVSGEIATPKIRSTREERTRTGSRRGNSPRTSMRGPALPPQRSRMSCVARSTAAGVLAKSTPRSKRNPASVTNASRRALPWMTAGFQNAPSRNTLRVRSLMPLCSPPMIPASPKGLLWSATSNRSGSSSSCWPLSSVSFSPAAGKRTTTSPSSIRAAEALGW